ncbi:hypothetical protein KSP39_PZI019109 [Platanthera zijinensis]|uniref:Uncharacterized protein n=1 Tax=Platanthera zijinensis TaxID=2320716 RepID=A0AAP0B1J3_9ASPA
MASSNLRGPSFPPLPLSHSRRSAPASTSTFPSHSPRCPRLHRRNRWSACAADTLLAGARREEGKGGARVEVGDLKSWLVREGLPPCKVVLRERNSHDGKHRPIHYVAASEDLQAGDVAFSVPNSLVVTLERVLGDETVGMEILYVW